MNNFIFIKSIYFNIDKIIFYDFQGTGCSGLRHYLQSNETSFLDAQLLSQWPNLRNREKRGLKCDGFGSDWLWTQSWCQHGALKPNRFNRKCSKKSISTRGGFLVGYPHPTKINPHPRKIPIPKKSRG